MAASIGDAVGFRLVFVTLLLAGCTSINPGPQTFEGTEWRVTAINGQVTPATDAYRMDFRDGRAGGRFGCNRFGGTFAVAGDTMTFGPMIATRMACPEPAMSFEARGLTVLQQRVRLQWQSANRLTLANASGFVALERAG